MQPLLPQRVNSSFLYQVGAINVTTLYKNCVMKEPKKKKFFFVCVANDWLWEHVIELHV